MRWLLLPVSAMLWIAACADAPPPEAPSTSAATSADPDPEFQPETAVYRCQAASGEVTLVTRTRQNGMHVFLPPDPDGGHLDCELDRRASIWEHAKLNGVDFRATGNEPGWVLEVREGERLDLSYDYGQSSLSVPIDETSTDTASRTTTFSGTAAGLKLTVTLSGEGCSDTMSDETFPTRVEVAFAERKLSGCGRPLH
jgi:uncharacterized membrane protein